MTKLKANIYAAFILIVIVATAATMVVVWHRLSKTIDQLAKDQINETNEVTETHLDAYFSSARNALLQLHEFTNNGLLDAEFETDQNLLLLPLFNNCEQLATFAVARSDGNEFSLLKEDTTWLNNLVYETDTGMNIHRQRWYGQYQNRRIVDEWEDYKADYDPRTRDWFKSALVREDSTVPYWTNPYRILFQTFPGITLSMKSGSRKPGAYNIVQLDILLTELSKFTSNLSFSENGRVFILSENLDVIGLPKDDRFESPDSLSKYLMTPYNSVNHLPMKVCVDKLTSENQPFGEAFNFENEEKNWWGSVSKYQLDNNRYFLIGIVVPEEDFLGEVLSTRRIILISGFLIFAFILVVTKGYFDKRKANNLLAVKNDEIQAQRDLVTLQKEEIEQVHKEITDSITYAKRIQHAILPSDRIVKDLLPNSFILYKPKDIVAGDFYWIEQFKNRDDSEGLLIAAADCTGHGVPGAMVSVVCHNALNRALREYGILDPGKILEKTREIVISEFGKSEEEVKDGMDIALCSLDLHGLQDFGGLRKAKLKYAGANNPIWIIRKDASEVEEIKGDKQPVGKYAHSNPFTTHEINLGLGDQFYIFTDGFQDQFGGEKGKKFKAANFKKLLLSIRNENMDKQRILIDEAFEKWRSWHGEEGNSDGYEQIDDVCVIGVRI